MAEYGYDPIGQYAPNANAIPGSAEYEMSRTYFLANPTQRFQDLTAQYAQQHYSVLGSSGIITPLQQQTFATYNTPATQAMVGQQAATLGALYGLGQIGSEKLQSGVSELSRQYGYTSQSLGNIATSARDYVSSVLTGTTAKATAAMETTGGADYTAALIGPTGQNVPLVQSAVASALTNQLLGTQPSDTYTLKGPFGSISEIDNAKIRLDPLTGEIGVYTKNNLGQWTLSGGVGRYGAQSGEYSIVNEQTGKSVNLESISPFWTENLGKISAPGANIAWSLSPSAAGLATVNEKGQSTAFGIENATAVTPSISRLTGIISSSALAATNPETYTIKGNFGTVSEIDNAKIIVNPVSGEASIYTKNALGQWTQSAGIGMYGSQSGQFTIINDQTGQKTNLASLVGTTILPESTIKELSSVISPWGVSRSTAGLSEITKAGITGISSGASSVTTIMPTQVAGTSPMTLPTPYVSSLTAKGTSDWASSLKDSVTGLLSTELSNLGGSISFWTPVGLAGTKNVVESKMPLVGDIPYIGSAITGVANWITPQGFAQVTTPAGLQVQKDLTKAQTDYQTAKAQYDLAKVQYDKDYADATAIKGVVSLDGKSFDTSTPEGLAAYNRINQSATALQKAADNMNAAGSKISGTYSTAVAQGLYTVDATGNYIPTAKAQTSTYDQLNEYIRTSLNLPSPEIGEQQVTRSFAIGNLWNPLGWAALPAYANSYINTALPESLQKPATEITTLINPIAGQYTQLYKDPLGFAASTAIGFVLGGATEGVSRVIGATATGERVAALANPLLYTTRAGTEIRAIPAAMTALYGLGMGYEATEGGTNLNPVTVSSNLKGLFLQQAVPMTIGGIAGVRSVDYITGLASHSNLWQTVAGEPREYTVETTPTEISFSSLKNTISDTIYGIRQRAMGIENIGPNSGLTYYSENFETPWQTSEAARQTPAGISGFLNSINPTYEEAVGGAYSRSTAVTTVPYERTIMGSAYDISYSNAQYTPSEELLRVQTSRTLITPSEYGGIQVAEQFTPLTLSSEAYARATGIDVLPATPSTVNVADVFRTQTVRDVYPSGRTYENVIGKKGRIVLPGTEISGIISSRGVTVGERSVYEKMMSAADQIIDTAIPQRVPPSRISAVDLPTAVTDISVGYGATKVDLMSGVETAQTATRVVRAQEGLEDIFGREALYAAEIGAPVDVLLPGEGQGALVGLSKTLPSYGVKGTEVWGAVPNIRPAPITSAENVFDVDKEISDLLYGQEAGRFGTEAERLRETGTERLLRSGQDIRSAGITPLSQTFGKAKGGIGAGVSVKPGSPALLMAGISEEENIRTAQHIGSVIEEVLGQAQREEAAQEEKAEPVAAYEPRSSGLSQYAQRQQYYEEEIGITPSEEALRRTGLYERGAVTGPEERMGIRAGVVVMPASTQEMIRMSGIGTANALRQPQASVKANINDVINDVLGKQEVVPESITDVIGKQETTPITLQDILGKQEVKPATAQDILGKQMVTPAVDLTILTGIKITPTTQQEPPTKPVPEEKPPTPFNFPGLGDLKQGGAWGSGKQSGTIWTERIKLMSARDVLFGTGKKKR